MASHLEDLILQYLCEVIETQSNEHDMTPMYCYSSRQIGARNKQPIKYPIKENVFHLVATPWWHLGIKSC